jgi:hypothetical protein
MPKLLPDDLLRRRIQALVHRAIADRTPVGYQRGFLESYVPNETEYLPENLKTHLRELGRTPDGHRPAGTYARDILNRLLIDLSWASSRLEGNTYSLLDTRELWRSRSRSDARTVAYAWWDLRVFAFG